MILNDLTLTFSQNDMYWFNILNYNFISEQWGESWSLKQYYLLFVLWSQNDREERETETEGIKPRVFSVLPRTGPGGTPALSSPETAGMKYCQALTLLHHREEPNSMFPMKIKDLTWRVFAEITNQEDWRRREVSIVWLW